MDSTIRETPKRTVVEWAETYASESVRAEARRRAARWTLGFAMAAGVLVAAAPVLAFTVPTWAGWVLGAFGSALSAFAVVVLVKLRRLHRRVWRVDLSATALDLCDVAGRRERYPWTLIERVDLARGGVTVAVRRRAVRLGPDWPDIDRLARRAVQYAEAHRRPVLIDGVPWTDLSLDALCDALQRPRSAPGA